MVFGLGLFLFAWSLWFWVSWGFLFLVGAGSMVPMGTTALQLTVPADMQGRILSLWYLGTGFMFIGSLSMAMVADVFGWQSGISGRAAMLACYSGARTVPPPPAAVENLTELDGTSGTLKNMKSL